MRGKKIADKVASIQAAEAQLSQLQAMLSAATTGGTDTNLEDPAMALAKAREAAEQAERATREASNLARGSKAGVKLFNTLLSLERDDRGRSQWAFAAASSSTTARAYEVRAAAAGKGMGIFAARDVQVGERILAEAPLARWTIAKNQPSHVRLKSFAAVVEGMSSARREAFFSLSQAEHHHAQQRTMMGTWLTNALPIEYEDGNDEHDTGAIFATICRLNHACAPNCHHEWNAALGMETVHAIRPIRKGEELSISYLLPAGRPRAERQARLREQFGFSCGCAMCAVPDGMASRSDACQRAIGDLQPEGGLPLAELCKRLEVRLGLMAKEGMPSVWARPLLLAAMVQAAQDKSAGGRAKTVELHARALESLKVSTGTDHPNYRVIESFLATVSQFDSAMGAFAGASAAVEGRAALAGAGAGGGGGGGTAPPAAGAGGRDARTKGGKRRPR